MARAEREADRRRQAGRRGHREGGGCPVTAAPGWGGVIVSLAIILLCIFTIWVLSWERWDKDDDDDE
ncbi:hypothetical protein SEA_VASUNZINGA_97 [Mycobacterium phage VasuNzinga]|uniref:Uncharacterized protein n=1 Tax=Mycobacterium phage VasuNzinga TaxID=2301620 RepID=A0A385UGJ7_9CAUD|nr:hypothetical protein SEA_VASUNZINGA_97 [Mycobacterium phage VasuNzinga]